MDLSRLEMFIHKMVLFLCVPCGVVVGIGGVCVAIIENDWVLLFLSFIILVTFMTAILLSKDALNKYRG